MDKFYYDKYCLIADHVTKLNCYLQVLKTYAEYEMGENAKIGNIYEILDLAVKEINIITKNI